MRNIVWIAFILFVGCSSPEKKQAQPSTSSAAEETAPQANNSFADISSAVFKIETFENSRILESGMGFFIAPDIAVTRLSFFESANKAVIEPFNEKKSYQISGFFAIDRLNDLILLKAEGIQHNPVELSDSILNNKAKTIYLSRPTTNVVPLHEGNVLNYSSMLGTKLYRVSNQLGSKSAGSPMFDDSKKCIGLAFMQVADYETQTFVTPSIFITALLKKAGKLQPLSELHSPSAGQAGNGNTQVKGLIIETDRGNIRIRLYDKTPQYRDNFIKLARENYFDDLLIHRVIKEFGIQSGAADTRYATEDDVVGWKGPGYTLPAHFVPGLYHKRGAIGSPRKPETQTCANAQMDRNFT